MSLFTAFHYEILKILLGLARLLPLTLFLPYFNSQLMGGMIVKNVILCLMVVGMLPLMGEASPDTPVYPLLQIIGKEIVIGLICGICLAVPFWIALTIGEIIDNQRGLRNPQKTRQA